MRVTVMNIGKVGMRVPHPNMPVRMRMRLSYRIKGAVFMLMMFIVNMAMLMSKLFVFVLV